MRLAASVFLLGLGLLVAAAFLVHLILGIAIAGAACISVAALLIRGSPRG